VKERCSDNQQLFKVSGWDR